MFSTYHHTGNFTVTVVLTAWHLMAQGQRETFLPIYILKKVEIWSGATKCFRNMNTSDADKIKKLKNAKKLGKDKI